MLPPRDASVRLPCPCRRLANSAPSWASWRRVAHGTLPRPGEGSGVPAASASGRSRLVAPALAHSPSSRPARPAARAGDGGGAATPPHPAPPRSGRPGALAPRLWSLDGFSRAQSSVGPAASNLAPRVADARGEGRRLKVPGSGSVCATPPTTPSAMRRTHCSPHDAQSRVPGEFNSPGRGTRESVFSHHCSQ